LEKFTGKYSGLVARCDDVRPMATGRSPFSWLGGFLSITNMDWK
jgi:hypothetical protein